MVTMVVWYSGNSVNCCSGVVMTVLVVVVVDGVLVILTISRGPTKKEKINIS